MAWTLAPGTAVARRLVHQEYGGSRQGGMTRAGDNLLLFSSDSGKLYGYDFDGPKSDGAYHYTGEGQIGDQTFVRNNRLLRDHAQLGLHPRLFERVKGPVVRYVGEYQLASDRPYYPEEARDVNGDTRKVIVFRLLPVGSTAPGTPGAAPAVTVATVRDVPIEDHVAETFQTTPTAEPTTAEKREANLVRRYTKYLRHTAARSLARKSGSRTSATRCTPTCSTMGAESLSRRRAPPRGITCASRWANYSTMPGM